MAGPPPVPATCPDPLLAEVVALLGKEVLKLKTEKGHLEDMNSAEVKLGEVSAAGDHCKGELQQQTFVRSLNPSAPAFHPVRMNLHRGSTSQSRQPRPGPVSRRLSSKRIVKRDPVLEDVTLRLEEEVARIRQEDLKLELSSAILKLTESVVDVEMYSEQSAVTSHAKVVTAGSCDQHESDHFVPTYDPVLDNIMKKLEVKVAEIKKGKVTVIKEGRETVIKEGKMEKIKEGKVADNKEGAIRGNISSMDGKSTEDMGEEKLEQEMGCLCLRSMKLILCRECGSNFEGRLSTTCSVHPRACTYCLQTDFNKLQEFDLPSKKEFAVSGNQMIKWGTPIVEV